MSVLQLPTQTTKALHVGDIVLAVRLDGKLVHDRVASPDGAGWQRIYGRSGEVWDAPHVAGVYTTAAEAAAAMDDASDAVDRFGDENDLLHPVPWNDVMLRLVHDGQGMVTVHPDDHATADFVRMRPTFFAALLRSIPTGQLLTPDRLRGIAAMIAQKVADKWRPIGMGCRVEVGPPTIVADLRFGAADT